MREDLNEKLSISSLMIVLCPMCSPHTPTWGMNESFVSANLVSESVSDCGARYVTMIDPLIFLM